MSISTKISWYDYTWNPVQGCTKRFANRFLGVNGHPCEQGFDVQLIPEALDLPRHWRKPRRIFVNSMSDMFHPDVPDEFLLRVFDVIRSCQNHTFIILTKRPSRMVNFCRRLRFDPGNIDTGRSGGLWLMYGPSIGNVIRNNCYPDGFGFSQLMDQLWLGVSCEDQGTADERIPLLLQTPSSHRFVLLEPLLEQIDLISNVPSQRVLRWYKPMIRGIDWVIVGGESGPRARPCSLEWILSIISQCKSSGVPCFVKQLGEWLRITHPDKGDGWCSYSDYHVRSRAGGDSSKWPDDLRVQEFPEDLL